VRTLLASLAFVALAAAGPQNSSDLRARYGQPDVERFAMRPDITVTVQYGHDGKACILLIEPRQAFVRSPSHTQRLPTISVDAAWELLDEAVPRETRGKLLGPGPSFQSGCTAFETNFYENMSICFVHSYCVKPDGVWKAQVNFKRTACDSDSK
jgi:hypothetical protein